MTKILLPLIVAVLACAGCSRDHAKAMDAFHQAVVAETKDMNGPALRTLFDEDRMDLTDEELATILKTQVPLDRRTAIAVHNCSWAPSFPGRMGGQLAALQEGIPTNRLAKIPGLLLPDTPRLADLRKAAARLQCPYILIYSLQFKAVDHTAWYAWFGGGKQVTLGTVEALLYDIRTGIVPCTATVDMTAPFSEEEAEDDPDGWRQEAMNRAIVGAMGKLSLKLAAFIADKEQAKGQGDA